MGEKRSQTLCQHDIRLHLGVLFVRDRRHVDGVLNHAALQILLHLQCDLIAHGFLRFVGRPTDVRRQNDIVECSQRGIFQRLFLEDVEGRAAHVTLLQGLSQGGFVHQFAAGAVHDAHAFLHFLDGFAIDHAGGLRRQADVQCEVIGSLVDVLQPPRANALFLDHAGGYERIVPDDLHAECFRATGDFHPNLAQSNHTQSFSPKLGPLQGFLFPFAGVHKAVSSGKETGQAEHHAQG